ncbi:MAG: hypothetical protein O3A20_02225 [Planctomycetota bacterium]|nr:hypothetical protein [Planctomycetota bacterium]
MRRVATFTTLLMLTACSRQTGSTLRFETDRLDLGILHQYEDRAFTLPFTVEGGEAVRLDSLEVSCGCTDVSLVVDGEVLLLAQKKIPATGAAPSAEEESLTAHAGQEEILLPAGTRGEVRGNYHPERRLHEQIVSISVRGSMLNSPARAELRTVVQPLFVIEPIQVVFGKQVDSALNAQAQTREVLVRCAREFKLRGWQKVPPCLRIEDLGVVSSDGGATGFARRYRFTLDGSAPHGVVEQIVSAGTDVGPDLEILVSWKVVGPATYAPDQRVQLVGVPFGKQHERGVKIRPSLPEIQLPQPSAEILGDATAVLRVQVERLPADADLPEGWLVRCTLPAETAPGAYSGTLRISYPDGAELATHEMIVNIRVQEPR